MGAYLDILWSWIYYNFYGFCMKAPLTNLSNTFEGEQSFAWILDLKFKILVDG